MKANVRRYIKYTPPVWIIESDPGQNAKELTNWALNKNIRSLTQMLFCVHLMHHGIRSKRIFNLKFDRAHRDITFEEMGIFIDGKLSKPTMEYFTNKLTKWASRCKERYMFFVDHLNACLNEYEYRYGRQHQKTPLALGLLGSRLSDKLLETGLSNVTIPISFCLPKYRTTDIISSYRKYYASMIHHPLEAYANTKRDVPDFLQKGLDLFLPSNEQN